MQNSSKSERKEKRTPNKIKNGKSLIEWQTQMLKHIKRMEYNCHIPDLEQAFSNVENCGLNLVVLLMKPLTCTDLYDSRIEIHHIDNNV